MDSLQYDPLTKQQIKDSLYEFLYAPVTKQFQNRLDTLIIRNTLLAAHSHKSFVHKGVVYSCDAEPPPRRWNKLLPELRPQMEDYLRDVRQVMDQEIPYVLGYINKVLNSSNSVTDYMQLFPDCVHAPLQKLAATCPCQNTALTTEKIQQLSQANETSINLIKQRMVMNLLI